ncbi:MAG: hypothetical protein JJD97_07610 [Gemmatimonadaceae bacterium]|nr:hypothetical protein [Gemmatimonadaceae bacterium]
MFRTPLRCRLPPALVFLALAGSSPALRAQQLGDSAAAGKITHPRPRALAVGIIGAVAGALAGFGFSKGGRQNGAGMTIIGGTAGGLAGFFVGRQLDERRAIAFRGTPSLHIPNMYVELEGDPSALALRDSAVLVGGSAGVEVYSALDPQLTPLATRAEGLRGIEALDLAPRSGWLAIGSRTGLYLYPPVKGPGLLVRRIGVNAIAAADTRVFIGTDTRVESVPVAADSVREFPGTVVRSPIRDLALDDARAVLWASTDHDLVSLHIVGDSLVQIGSIPLAGSGLRVALRGPLAAVAMGEKGVALIDISDATQPKLSSIWTTAHFAYDVSIDQSRLFVAAGPEGVYVVDLSGDAPHTIGLARSLGFASGVVSHDGHTFILDRRTNALRRIVSTY